MAFALDEILLTEETIRDRVTVLADVIARDYAGKDLVLIGILKGALVFMADLIRRLPFPVSLDLVHVSSYGMGTESTREIRVKKDIETDISGRNVLLADCIIDTGETMDFLLKRYAARKPASIRSVVLLDKRSRRSVPITVDYSGFVIPDRFVVGYGIDCGEQFRNLPYIASVRTAP